MSIIATVARRAAAGWMLMPDGRPSPDAVMLDEELRAGGLRLTDRDKPATHGCRRREWQKRRAIAE